MTTDLYGNGFGCIGKDIARTILEQVQLTTPKKFFHTLRLVCKNWKEHIKEISSCVYCKDDCRISIEYLIEDSHVEMDEIYFKTEFLGNIWLGQLKSTECVSQWNYEHSWHMGGYQPKSANAKCVLSEQDRKTMIKLVQELILNPNIPDNIHTWNHRNLSTRFEHCWTIFQGNNWGDESITVSTPHRSLKINLCSPEVIEDEYYHAHTGDYKQALAVKRSLLSFVDNNSSQDFSKQEIPEYQQLMKFVKAVQVCCCMFDTWSIEQYSKLQGSTDFRLADKPFEDRGPSLEEEMQAWQGMAIQTEDYTTCEHWNDNKRRREEDEDNEYESD